MKQPKKPTRDQKGMIAAAGLDWHSWMIQGEDKSYMYIVSKRSGQRRKIPKG